ncbi:hypothetical protein [Acinetobacter sp. P8-3-8]|uniref:hypothetical protein n=1 Tax=Acinetobacter sp. P8-3-8 TaxID=1029823 RepID=UPI0002487AC6|nr:hypothetical protein [Acinetobacter sp. P8-3-8]
MAIIMRIEKKEIMTMYLEEIVEQLNWVAKELQNNCKPYQMVLSESARFISVKKESINHYIKHRYPEYERVFGYQDYLVFFENDRLTFAYETGVSIGGEHQVLIKNIYDLVDLIAWLSDWTLKKKFERITDEFIAHVEKNHPHYALVEQFIAINQEYSELNSMDDTENLIRTYPDLSELYFVVKANEGQNVDAQLIEYAKSVLQQDYELMPEFLTDHGIKLSDIFSKISIINAIFKVLYFRQSIRMESFLGSINSPEYLQKEKLLIDLRARLKTDIEPIARLYYVEKIVKELFLSEAFLWLNSELFPESTDAMYIAKLRSYLAVCINGIE